MKTRFGWDRIHWHGLPDYPEIGVYLDHFGGIDGIPDDMTTFVNTTGNFHCFTDDHRLESIWRSETLRTEKAAGRVCTSPDFSIFLGDPLPFAQFQAWRSKIVGAKWEKAGAIVIPTVQFGGEETWPVCVQGVRRGSVLAIRGPGRGIDPGIWRAACEYWQEAVQPSAVIQFGRKGGIEAWKCPVVFRPLRPAYKSSN